MKLPPASRNHALKDGFTLIELLVVIAIIAVLAGLLFPAMGAVRTQARKTSAKNDVMQIVNAVKNFYVDYGRYPVSTSEDDVSYTDGNATLINELRVPATGSTINPRLVRYLEVPEKDVVKPRSAIEKTSGDWYDPWQQTYLIFIDAKYDNQVTVSGLSDSTDAVIKNGSVNTGVAVASKGPPDSAATPKFKTPVGSWN